MTDWRSRCQITDDVCYFQYAPEGLEKNVEEVFIWDLDKTYLDTTIESIGQLLVTVVERSFNKKNVPGTKTLLKALHGAFSQRRGQTRFPIYFITASPPQMEARISEKFTIDGIRPFGVFYKDNLRNLSPRRFWRLRKQIGYKVQSLLQLRTRLNANVKQVCWGDDSEADAIIYNLYSDICARRLGTQDLRAVLKSLGVTNEQVDVILMLQSQIPEQDPIEKIYINLASDTDPDYYLKFGRRTVPTYNTFQVAMDLFQDRRLDFEGVLSVAHEMMMSYGFTPDELARSFDELVRRHVLGEQCVEKSVPQLIEKGILYSDYKPRLTPSKESKVENGHVYELEGHFEPWIPSRVDYLHDYR
jgi:hypothetical protein